MAALPSITIVTPTFNAAETLEETLASIAAQNYPQLEHVVIDGGSTDGTLEILEREAAAGRLTFISEPDDGLSDAFNKGVARARSDWIGWLNADDTYEPGALLAVGEAIAADRSGAEWITGRCKIMGESGAESRTAVTKYKNWLLGRYSLDLYLTNNFISSPATFFRKSAAEAAGGALDTRFRYSADYDLWLRLARRGEPIILDADIARFRMGEGSLSITGFEDQFKEHAQNARENGAGFPVSVAINRLLSRLIVLIYRATIASRRLR